MVKPPASLDESDAWSAFETEVLPHADRLFRLAMWFERNPTDAEDVVPDTMMQALRSFHRFRPGTRWPGLARHDPATRRQQPAAGERAVNRRQQSRRDTACAHCAVRAASIGAAHGRGAAGAVSGGCPSTFQEVIVLCDVEELSYKEAAEALGIPVGAGDVAPASRPCAGLRAGARGHRGRRVLGLARTVT